MNDIMGNYSTFLDLKTDSGEVKLETIESIAKKRDLKRSDVNRFMARRLPENYSISAKLIFMTEDQLSKLFSNYFSLCQLKL